MKSETLSSDGGTDSCLVLIKQKDDRPMLNNSVISRKNIQQRNFFKICWRFEILES